MSVPTNNHVNCITTYHHVSGIPAPADISAGAGIQSTGLNQEHISMQQNT